MKYAKQGYVFFSVSTPSTFVECELPEDHVLYTKKEAKQWAELEALAERHGTTVEASNYERG